MRACAHQANFDPTPPHNQLRCKGIPHESKISAALSKLQRFATILPQIVFNLRESWRATMGPRLWLPE